MTRELKVLAEKVCPEHREAFGELASSRKAHEHFRMNTPFGVHILGCDNCEAAVSELIQYDETRLEKNILCIESASPYLPLPTEENTARAW